MLQATVESKNCLFGCIEEVPLCLAQCAVVLPCTALPCLILRSMQNLCVSFSVRGMLWCGVMLIYPAVGLNVLRWEA